MIELLKKTALRRKQPTSLLGLALDGSRLEATVLRRSNGSAQAIQTAGFVLSLDPLTADPLLVGREIRNQLDAAGIRERACAVALPLNWALTAHVEVPSISDEDLPAFLEIEGERGFPCDATTLQVCHSRFQTPAGQRHALLVGIPRTHLSALERALRAARLKPVRFGLGLAALQPPAPSPAGGTLALLLGEGRMALQVTCGGGVAALRVLEAGAGAEAGRAALEPEAVAREIRITLGQIPDGLRETVRQVRIFGPRDLSQHLADELEMRLESLHLEIEPGSRRAASNAGPAPDLDGVASAAFSVAADCLTARPAVFEFLPPRVSAWRQAAQRYASGRMRTAGAVAAGLAVIVGAFFLWQQFQLLRLQAQWRSIGPKVRELEKVQDDIRKFRPWYDDSFRAMRILRDLTQAFPEDGVVWARTIEIRDLAAVACTGQAREHQALLRTHEKLRASSAVSELKVSQIRGKAPEQFTFDFRWNEGGRVEN